MLKDRGYVWRIKKIKSTFNPNQVLLFSYEECMKDWNKMTLLLNYCRHFIFSKSSNKDCTCFHESNLYVIYYSHHHSHHHHRHNHHHHPHHYNTLIITIIIMIIFVFIKLLYSKRTSSDITAFRNSFLMFWFFILYRYDVICFWEMLSMMTIYGINLNSNIHQNFLIYLYFRG